MLDNLLTVSLAVATISAGIMAGVYFAFSAFIMHAFNQLGPVKATDAMNAINEVILRCLLYTSPSPRDKRQSRMPSSA